MGHTKVTLVSKDTKRQLDNHELDQHELSGAVFAIFSSRIMRLKTKHLVEHCSHFGVIQGSQHERGPPGRLHEAFCKSTRSGELTSYPNATLHDQDSTEDGGIGAFAYGKLAPAEGNAWFTPIR